MSFDLVIDAMVARGGQSTVFRGRYDGKAVAIKVFDEQQVCRDEFEVLNKVQHVPGLAKLLVPSILQIQIPGQDSNAQGLALVFDLMPDDLYQFALSRKRPLAISNVLSLAKQLLTTVSELNKLGITHNDIKPENILVKDTRVKQISARRELHLINPEFTLIDFAYASADCIIAGTSTYYSPEQLSNQGGVCRSFGNTIRSMYTVSQKVDVWAIGCVLVEMHSGLRLFDFTNDTRRFAGIYQILSNFAPISLDSDTADKTTQYIKSKMQTTKDQKLIKQGVQMLRDLQTQQPILFELVMQMLSFDPRVRPSAQQLLQCSLLESQIQQST